jgi:hypothetical protein
MSKRRRVRIELPGCPSCGLEDTFEWVDYEDDKPEIICIECKQKYKFEINLYPLED